MKRAMTQEAKDARACAILDAAEKLLLTGDYMSLKMADIAREAGISNGLIFTYFHTKETLFLCLLWREFKERIAYLQDVIARKQPADFEEIEALVLSELEHVLQENSVYIKLEPMRPSILEKNVDPALLDRMKEDLAARFLELSDNLSRSGAVSREDVLDIFFAEIGIIIGSGLQKAVEPDFDLRGGIIARMKCYLQGFRQIKRDKGEK